VPALHCAASRGHHQCIEVLRKAGADVNLMDNNSCTPLFYAITLGTLQCTRALVTAKADVNHVDERGRKWVTINCVFVDLKDIMRHIWSLLYCLNYKILATKIHDKSYVTFFMQYLMNIKKEHKLLKLFEMFKNKFF